MYTDCVPPIVSLHQSYKNGKKFYVSIHLTFAKLLSKTSNYKSLNSLTFLKQHTHDHFYLWLFWTNTYSNQIGFSKGLLLQKQILLQKDKVIIFPWHIQQFLPYQALLTLQLLLTLQFHSIHIYWGPTIYWSFLCQGNINANKILNSQFLPQCFGIFPPPSTHGRAIKQSKIP